MAGDREAPASLEEEAVKLAKLRMSLEAYAGEYVEAAREAAKLLLIVEGFLVYASSLGRGAIVKAAEVIAGRLRGLFESRDDPPRVFAEAHRLAGAAALAQAYAEASMKVYLFTLTVSVLLASLIFASAFIQAQLTVASATALAAALGLLVGATLLAARGYSLALASASLVVYAFVLGATLPVLAEAVILATGFASSRVLEYKGLARASEKVLGVEAG